MRKVIQRSTFAMALVLSILALRTGAAQNCDVARMDCPVWPCTGGTTPYTVVPACATLPIDVYGTSCEVYDPDAFAAHIQFNTGWKEADPVILCFEADWTPVYTTLCGRMYGKLTPTGACFTFLGACGPITAARCN